MSLDAGLWSFFLLFVAGFERSIPYAMNILAAMAGLYGMQGLAIVTFHINRLSIGRLPKVIFWVIFFLTFAFFSVFLIIIGIFDNWFNLRYAPGASASGEKGNNNEKLILLPQFIDRQHQPGSRPGLRILRSTRGFSRTRNLQPDGQAPDQWLRPWS